MDIHTEPGKHKYGTKYHERCNRIRNELSKKIYQCVRDGNLYGILYRVDRYNRLTLASYPGMQWLTPGDVLNNALESIFFDSI